MKLFDDKTQIVKLPAPVKSGTVSVEEALAGRESVREFASDPLDIKQISQLLWAGYGVTRKSGGKTTPSAGALYPLELYISLNEGVFHYDPLNHQLERISKDNVKAALAQAALGQACVSSAPLIIIITAVYERSEQRYGSRAERYVKIEAGHAAQNIHLQAVVLGLGSVPIGAFHDEQVQKVLGLPNDHKALYLIPSGHRSR